VPGWWTRVRSVIGTLNLRHPGRLVVAGLVLALVIGAVVLGSGGGPAPVQVRDLQVSGTPEQGHGPIVLDASLYLPVHRPAPAVLLAHGFGGSKNDLDGDARYLAEHGYVVLAYTARGFGRSGGLVHLDSPDFEVKDAQRMLDVLAGRPEVLRDGKGDPRVGVAGASYGGGLSLLLAGADRRVDAIAPDITWNDLRQSLFPQFAQNGDGQASPADSTPVLGPGVFKKLWAATFFGGALAGGDLGAAGPGATVGGNQACARFDVTLCGMYSRVASGFLPTAADLALLARSSPSRVLSRITAPTLLIQGQADSLFPLSEADANARGIAAHGTPVKVVWSASGHDGGLDETARLRTLTLNWFDRYVRRDGSAADTRFEVTVPDALVSSVDSNPAPQVRAAPFYPGLGRHPAALHTTSLPLHPPGPSSASSAGQPVGSAAAGPAGVQVLLAPPGGLPASISTLPGLGSALGLAGATGLGGGFGSAAAGATGSSSTGLGLGGLPGQTATFDTAPVKDPLTLIGGGRVTVQVQASGTDATLFASLLDVGPDGTARQPEQLVTPVQVSGLSPAGRQLTIALPAVVHDVPVGHRLRVSISTTDQGYKLPPDPRVYRISMPTGAALTLPAMSMTPVADSSARTLLLVGLAMAMLLAAAALISVLRNRRRRVLSPDPALADVPLALSGLGKVYSGGFRAVAELSFQVTPGQVLGLLGPNGAGKTTALRMVMGLIRPTEGEVRVFGYPVVAGSPVLSRVGAFIEGPGFLPHLSGLENLQLFWRATGRPAEDAHLEDALEVAGLGDDVHRRVRTYSHGMRQRLAIAQAMLGLPDLLVLDEPTNGLDPPQIREMRQVLARYAATGRTVVISSHLLAEVEQTCTDVVVMNRGVLVAQGPVTEIASAASVVAVDVDDPVHAAEVAEAVTGVHDVTITPSGLLVRVSRAARSQLVRALVAAGLEVERVAPQHGLEEAFLALVGEEPAELVGEG
jgi:ABC-2 type transport system ATP-binding protein